MDQRKSAVIFVNGELQHPKQVLPRVESADIWVAADGGLKHALAMGIVPHVLIGDLDSVEEKDVLHLETLGSTVLRSPVEKDETDLELAFDYVLQKGIKKIILVGALGGRTDHMLANLMMLTDEGFSGLDVRLVDCREEVFIIREAANINGKKGDLVSLIPLSEKVTGVTTDGLRYPLENESLQRWKTRGISNEMLKETAKVKINTGLLLCVHSLHSEKNKEISL